VHLLALIYVAFMHGYFLNRARPILVRHVFAMKYDVIFNAGKWPVSRLKIRINTQLHLKNMSLNLKKRAFRSRHKTSL
jgi:hypothetical protein